MNENTPREEIELDRKRYMTFTFRVAKRFKDLMGKSVLVLDESMEFEDLSTLLWLTLLDDDPELTQEEADGLFNMRDLDIYAEKLTSLMAASTPDSSGEDPKEESPTSS